MKTLSGTFAFVVLAVIAVVTILSCRAKHAYADQKFTLYIGEYAEVADEDQDAFKKALKKLKEHGGQCDLTFLPKEGQQLIKDYCKNLDLSLKTDKVTKSELASSAAAGESAANDPNFTHKVTSNEATDFKDVVKMFNK